MENTEIILGGIISVREKSVDVIELCKHFDVTDSVQVGSAIVKQTNTHTLFVSLYHIHIHINHYHSNIDVRLS